jgi:predicted TPR repeat methyltransferase|tara:strand:+ start:8 stop:628 length:621 start_codon:yes stop_codon:yes gene_type:complete
MSEKNFLSQSYDLETQDDTLAHYEAWAETYDQELSENDYAQPQRCASALASHIDERDIRILDIGCGTGLSGVALKNLGFRNIEGCDFSSLMIEKAKDTNVYQGLFEADINKKLEIETETYDAAVAVGVLSFAHVRTDALREMLRIIKTGGLLVIGLNEKYWSHDKVGEKLEKLSQEQVLEVLSQEYGDHLPGTGLGGWVATIKKRH